MKLFSLIVAGVFCLMGSSFAGEVTPQQIVDKVAAASKELAAKGEPALAEFKKKDGKWSWENTYVQVYHCDKRRIVGHPVAKTLKLDIATVMDVRGNPVSLQICDAAKKPGGAWVEYWWETKDSDEPQRKVTFAYQVPGKPYQVSAGIYSKTQSLKELESFKIKD